MKPVIAAFLLATVLATPAIAENISASPSFGSSETTLANTVAQYFQKCASDEIVHYSRVTPEGMCATGYLLITDPDPDSEHYTLSEYAYPNMMWVHAVKEGGRVLIRIAPLTGPEQQE